MLSWKWNLGLTLGGLVVALICPLFLGHDLGGELAVAACTIAAWLGVHSKVPKFLRGRPKLASLVTAVCGGLALKVYGMLALFTGVKMMVGWGIAYLGCYVAGRPLTFDFGDPGKRGPKAKPQAPPAPNGGA